MSVRLPEVQAAYEHFKATYSSVCAFCDVLTRAPETIIESTDTMLILRNQFPYSTWDKLEIADHLMLVPKRHVLTLSEFTDKEQAEYFDIMQRYEYNRYSLYQRSQANSSRTVRHLHMHLLKPVVQ